MFVHTYLIEYTFCTFSKSLLIYSTSEVGTCQMTPYVYLSQVSSSLTTSVRTASPWTSLYSNQTGSKLPFFRRIPSFLPVQSLMVRFPLPPSLYFSNLTPSVNSSPNLRSSFTRTLTNLSDLETPHSLPSHSQCGFFPEYFHGQIQDFPYPSIPFNIRPFSDHRKGRNFLARLQSSLCIYFFCFSGTNYSRVGSSFLSSDFNMTFHQISHTIILV